MIGTNAETISQLHNTAPMMDPHYINEHTSCGNCNSPSKSGFNLLKLKKDERTSYREQSDDLHNIIIFVIEGEIELSYSQYTNRKFAKGLLVFVPSSTFISGSALKNSKLIILAFEYTLTNLCDKYTLNQYAESSADVDYDFRGLQVRSPLTEYLELLEILLKAGINCIHLHKLKQQELLLIFRIAYSPEEITELFYPILGEDVDFKSSVLAHYRVGDSAKKIASQMALSEVSFARRFKREFYTSYYQWMLKQKALHIKSLLTSPTTTIKEIIYELKFTDFSHFNRFCKEHLGSLPSELITRLRARETTK